MFRRTHVIYMHFPHINQSYVFEEYTRIHKCIKNMNGNVSHQLKKEAISKEKERIGFLSLINLCIILLKKKQCWNNPGNNKIFEYFRSLWQPHWFLLSYFLNFRISLKNRDILPKSRINHKMCLFQQHWIVEREMGARWKLDIKEPSP